MNCLSRAVNSVMQVSAYTPQNSFASHTGFLGVRLCLFTYIT